jgi:hypothetical protein
MSAPHTKRDEIIQQIINVVRDATPTQRLHGALGGVSCRRPSLLFAGNYLTQERISQMQQAMYLVEQLDQMMDQEVC